MLSRKVKILAISLCLVGILLSLTGLGIAGSIVRQSSDWPMGAIGPALCSGSECITAQVNLFDPLVFPDTKGNVVPHLAKSWDISPDRLTYTFYLRPGVKFHDGKELTAEDVKFSMDRLLAIGGANAYLWFDIIQETKVIDKFTVVFHLKNASGPFISTLPFFFIVNKGLIMENIKPGEYGDMGDYGTAYALINDTGSGPYIIKDYSRGEYLLMEKNPNYFLDINTAPDEFKMIGSREPVLLKTLMNNRELEMTCKWESPDLLEALAKIEGIEIAQWGATAYLYTITMNNKKPPLDDIHVRKALSWAFDYDEALKLCPGSIQAIGPVPRSLLSDPNCFQYHRNLEKAKLELKQSKYYGHFDEYPMEVSWNDGVLYEKFAMLLSSNAADIGLTVNVRETTWSLLVAAVSKMETTPHFRINPDSVKYPDASEVLISRYHSATAGKWSQLEWLLDPVFDKMIYEAVAIIDEEERSDKYREAMRYIVNLAASIFVLEKPEEHAYQAAYMDWPAAKGEAMPYYAYNNAARFIKIDTEKREKLLKK